MYLTPKQVYERYCFSSKLYFLRKYEKKLQSDFQKGINKT